MAAFLNDAIAYVTDPYWWLPKGITWQHMADARAAGNLLPEVSDFKEIGVYFVLFALTRWVLEKTLFSFLARKLIAHRPKLLRSKAPHALVLAAYEKADRGRVSDADCEALSKSTGVRAKKIEAWVAEIKEADALTKDASKWTETCWRFTFLTAVSVWEYYHVIGQSWAFNAKEQWANYPFQSIDPPVRTLYLMQLAIYFNLFVSQFTDVRRKDFVAMFIHHIATIMLIGYSYSVNFVRNGILVLMCHDPCDVFLELAKLCKYAGKQLGADLLFGAFVASWAFLRLFYLPFYVEHSWTVTFLETVAPFPSWYFFTGLLAVLQVLHVYWFALISRIVYNKLWLDKEVDDVREEEDEQDAAAAGKKALASEAGGKAKQG